LQVSTIAENLAFQDSLPVPPSDSQLTIADAFDLVVVLVDPATLSSAVVGQPVPN